MIIQFLDVKKRVIGTYTDKMVVDKVQRREIVGRFIQDSSTVSVGIEMKDIVEESKYFMITDGQKFRVNPIYQKDQVFIRGNNILEVDAKSESLDRAKEVEMVWNGGYNFIDFLNVGSEKIGFGIELKTNMTESELIDGVFELIEEEFTLSEAIDAVLQVVGGYAEFDTILKNNYVDKTILRIGDNLGRDYKDALIYGVNVRSFESTQREEGIVTAIEYTGMELGYDTDEFLTLERKNGDIPEEYVLPKTNRVARLTNYTDSNGKVRYLLEDTEATKRHGRYTTRGGVDAEPIIESFSNKDVPTIEDLIELSIAELDGKSIPQTQYNITAVVDGIDVADNLGIKVPMLGIDMTMPVLSIEYGLRGREVCAITVGEHLPTEMERVFEEITDNRGGEGREGNHGDLMYKDDDGNVYIIPKEDWNIVDVWTNIDDSMMGEGYSISRQRSSYTMDGWMIEGSGEKEDMLIIYHGEDWHVYGEGGHLGVFRHNFRVTIGRGTGIIGRKV